MLFPSFGDFMVPLAPFLDPLLSINQFYSCLDGYEICFKLFVQITFTKGACASSFGGAVHFHPKINPFPQ